MFITVRKQGSLFISDLEGHYDLRRLSFVASVLQRSRGGGKLNQVEEARFARVVASNDDVYGSDLVETVGCIGEAFEVTTPKRDVLNRQRQQLTRKRRLEPSSLTSLACCGMPI